MKTNHADLLNALDEMASSHAYALRRDVLRRAEQLILSQEQRIAELEQYKFALTKWLKKTDWVQEQIKSFPVQSLGRHRADVMTDEIFQLRLVATVARSLVKAKGRYHTEMSYKALVEALDSLAKEQP